MTTVVILEHAEKYWEEQGKPEKDRQWLRDEMTRLMDQVELEAIETLTAINRCKGCHPQAEDDGL